MDSDITPFAAILSGIGAAAVLIALLGIRFNRVKVAGTELSYERETQGLAKAGPARDVAPDDTVQVESPPAADEVPVKVDIVQGLGKPIHIVPIPITRLTRSIRDIDPALLRDYQSARNVSQHGHFLTHLLGPATRTGQKYSVAIRVTPREQADAQVVSAEFYLA